jgi:hypothetical protein
MTLLKSKIRHLAGRWPGAVLGLGGFLTIVWAGALVFLAYKVFVIMSPP